jgi:hypothetical protein
MGKVLADMQQLVTGKQFRTALELRRSNAIDLLTAGTLSDFARKLGMSAAQAANIVGPNPVRGIGNNLARRIESVFEKPVGWLDNDDSDVLARAASGAIRATTEKLCSTPGQTFEDWSQVDDECVAWAMHYATAKRLPCLDEECLQKAAVDVQRHTTGELRYINSRKLCDRIGTTAFGQVVDMPANQANQTVGPNPIRNIGHDLARRIESGFMKPKGWLDTDHVAAESVQRVTEGLDYLFSCWKARRYQVNTNGQSECPIPSGNDDADGMQ